MERIGYNGKPYGVGSRVELSPGCDLWMRGARFGTVRSIDGDIVSVKMDHPGVKRIQKFKSTDLQGAKW